MKRSISTILAAATCFGLASCFPKELTGDTYSRDEVGQSQQIRTGTVESTRFVKIQGGQNAGTLLGAVAGGFLGSEVGGGSGSTVGAIAGTAVGAAAGGAAQQKIGNKQGIELTIRFDNGQTESIVQEHTERETFSNGDRVRVIYGSGRIRVTH